jgi:transcriptional regulator with XRE-family HTH domain
MSGRAAELAETPQALWSRAELIQALRERDIGRVFRLVSQFAGISQTRLAIACSMTQPKISGIMRGTARVESLEVFERIADGLDMPDAARMTLGLSPKVRQSPAAGTYGRRPTAAGVPQGPRSPLGSESLRRALTGSGTSGGRGADAAAMQAFRSADLQVGGGHVYASVLAYLQADVGPRLLADEDGGGDPADLTAAAALTEMAGWMAHDAGRDMAAQRHFGRSLALAQLGGDHQLGAHVLGSMSHLASHLGQSDQAMALARRGQATLRNAAPSPDLEARLLAMEARGRAGRDEAGACAKLLTRAEAALGRKQPDDHRSPWVSQFDAGSLAGEAARCMTALRDWPEARRQAETTIRLRPGGRARSRAFGQLALAMAMVAQGHPDEACPIAQDAIDSTQSLGSFLVIEQLLGLRHALRPYGLNRVVADFADRLEECLRSRLWLYQWLIRHARDFAVHHEESP